MKEDTVYNSGGMTGTEKAENFCTRPSLCYVRILLGEISPLLSAMKKSVPHWSSKHQETERDPLLHNLRELQATLASVSSDILVDPNIFLAPFLAVIRSEETTGPVTKSALAAVNRMLNYGLISPDHVNAANAVEAIATAVTHARFVGTDQGADEVVLWEILTVLRTLMISPVGHLLTNESVCEILNSCFRICFETRLSELLRNCTEDALCHMIQLLFSRLPQFKDDPKANVHGKKLKMRAGGDKTYSKGKWGPGSNLTNSGLLPENNESETFDQHCSENVETAVYKEHQSTDKTEDCASVDSGINELAATGDDLDISHTHLAPDMQGSLENIYLSDNLVSGSCQDKNYSSNQIDKENKMKDLGTVDDDFINSQGVKFTQNGVSKASPSLIPYGMPCVREVFRFLISLTSPSNCQNTPAMILTSLNLLAVALEVGAEHVNNFPSLLGMSKNQLCYNMFLLLKPELKLLVFMGSLRICTLLFESLRVHLKFQFEMFLNKLMDIITSESISVSYSHKELALETVVHLWKIPGLISELYINYDCDLYASNIFEDFTKVLSKNAFPVQGLFSTNLLSLEALVTVIEIISSHNSSHVSMQHKVLKKTCSQGSTYPSVIAPVASGYLLGLGLMCGFSPISPKLKSRVLLVDNYQVSRDFLLAVKEKKKLLAVGTDQFNVKPEKGILFLQEHGILGPTNDDIVNFLRENLRLDKKIIGEYLSKKKNVGILSAFVNSFDFTGLRIDESLRLFLEVFRLPGEAPLISIIIEYFASHWHQSNSEPFGYSKEDAAFTLAYAVIMLNVDQHNQNAKKQNAPMTLDEFCKNLRGVNAGSDFDQDMLEEIYVAIRSEEIVMPAEQAGHVKENYLWKLLLRRGSGKEGKFLLYNNNVQFDQDLFSVCWGPTIASLSYIFDKSQDDAFIIKALSGFKKCASIAARFSMNDVFDNLVVSLCKFTTLTVNQGDSPEQISINFGTNKKAQLAARKVFKLVITHGDILRDGWKNILDILIKLFHCRLLPSIMTESEDFLDPSGKVSLVKDVPLIRRNESGILSSLYSYISLGDSNMGRGSTAEDIEHVQRAKACIVDCHPEKLIGESAFLRIDSLNDFLKAMVNTGYSSNLFGLPNGYTGVAPQDSHLGATYEMDENSQAFLLEIILQVFVANKDRAGGIWTVVRDYLYHLLIGASTCELDVLLERCVVAVLKVAKVLLRKPELANLVLQSLKILFILKPNVLSCVSLEIVAGIQEVLSLNADHIKEANDWSILLALLEYAGAGAKPSLLCSQEVVESVSDAGSVSDSEIASCSGIDSGHTTERGYCSDSGDKIAVFKHEAGVGTAGLSRSLAASPETIQSSGGWIFVGKEGEIESNGMKSVNEWDIVHFRELGEHKPEALTRSVDILTFLVRENHISLASLPSAIQACRTFVEATLNGGKYERKQSLLNENSKSAHRKLPLRKEEKSQSSYHRPKSPIASSSAYDADESDSDDAPSTYQHISEKLLDLMDTLHSSSGKIMGSVLSQSVWQQALCPLLQGMARYCCDSRVNIRNMALTYLQRALLNHDLHILCASEWESCFHKVLFPLMSKLLVPQSSTLIDETRVRVATLVQKVFLRHLTPLLTLPTFTALWLTVLDFMDKYLNTHPSDHLSDAIPEILKNMLLVMETTQVFHTSEGFTRLWSVTWERIDVFLPDFRLELFRSHPPSEIHRIEVVPVGSENVANAADAPVVADKCEEAFAEGVICHPQSVTVPLKSSTQASCDSDKLSLAHENQIIRQNIILQPPLPESPLSMSPPLQMLTTLQNEDVSASHYLAHSLVDFPTVSLSHISPPPSFHPIQFSFANAESSFDEVSSPVLFAPCSMPVAMCSASNAHSDSAPNLTSLCEDKTKESGKSYKPASLLFNSCTDNDFLVGPQTSVTGDSSTACHTVSFPDSQSPHISQKDAACPESL